MDGNNLCNLVFFVCFLGIKKPSTYWIDCKKSLFELCHVMFMSMLNCAALRHFSPKITPVIMYDMVVKICNIFGFIVGEECWRLLCSTVIFLNKVHEDIRSVQNFLNDLIWEYGHMMKDTNFLYE